MIVLAEADEGTHGWTVDYFTFLISFEEAAAAPAD
jgi:hypothetical protein